MRIKRIVANAKAVAIVEDEMPLITDPMVALEIMMRAKFELGAELLAIEASSMTPEFFDPDTGLAEDILQEFAEYGVKCAVFGDFAFYDGEKLNALGEKVFLAENVDQAIAWMTTA